MLDVEAAADDDGGVLGDGGQIAVDHRQDIVRGGDGLSVHRMHRPLVKRLFRQAVGNPQGLDGGGDRHHGEFRHHHDGKMLGKLFGTVAEHGLQNSDFIPFCAVFGHCPSASCRRPKTTLAEAPVAFVMPLSQTSGQGARARAFSGLTSEPSHECRSVFRPCWCSRSINPVSEFLPEVLDRDHAEADREAWAS
jgi:hypothetical protein